MRRKIVIAFMPFLAMVLSIACSNSQETDTQTNEKIVAVKVAPLQAVEMNRIIDLAADFIPFKENHLTSASPGRIEKIFVEVGNHVRAGAQLVQMDQTSLHQAEIQLKNLEADYNRLTVLQQNGAVAQQQYDQLKAQYEVAKSNVKFLKENTALTAPYAGIITGKYFEDGEMYSGSPNTSAGKAAIVSIMQLNPMKAEINITEADFSKITNGMEVDLTVDAYAGEMFKGKVYRIYPSLDPASRSFKVEISVPNQGERLHPGMSGRAKLQMGVAISNVVPANAVLKQAGSNQRFIFVNNNGVARRINVETGTRIDDKIEVISGDLTEGMPVIVAGQSGLDNGDKIKIAE